MADANTVGGGLPGRPPNPSGVVFHILTGSGAGLANPPKELSPQAKAVWKRAVRELRADGLDQARFRDLLELWCDAMVYARKTADVLDRAGPLVTRRREGQTIVVTNPASREFERYFRLVRAGAHEFGFTPSAVVRLERALTGGDLEQIAGDDDAAADEAEVISILAAARQRAKAAREAATGQQQ